MLHKFHGGVHIPSRKKATAALHTTPPAVPAAHLYLPVEEPLVAVGDRVEVGTRLCHGAGGRGAVHSGVSGVVEAIALHTMPRGGETLCAVIGNDTLNTPRALSRPIPSEAPPATLDGGDIRAAIAAAGIVDMDGRGLSVEETVEHALGRVDTLILNGCESDSYVTADHRLQLERPEDVLNGARLLARALGGPRVLIAVEGDKYDAVSALRALLPLRHGDVEVCPLRVRYPQGAREVLTRRFAGRSDGAGTLVFNVATAAAVCDAVYEGRAQTHRIVTVTGCVRNPKNLLVPMGTPIQDLVDACGGFWERPERLLAGGGMMGVAQRDFSAPITPGTAAVVALSRKDLKGLLPREEGCIRCGRCMEVCPMGLAPLYLRLYAEGEDLPRLAAGRLTECIDCGACTYICPTRQSLAGALGRGKELLGKEGVPHE